MLFILRTSKTHCLADKPQMIKISNMTKGSDMHRSGPRVLKIYSPYDLLRKYIMHRQNYLNENENFFIFYDRTAVKPYHFHTTLRGMLRISGYNENRYCCTAFHAGRASDLIKLGVSVESVKEMGRWKSNAVYKYLKL